MISVRRALALGAMLFATASCSEDDEDVNPFVAGDFPGVADINLTQLGASAGTALTSGGDCETDAVDGVFGLPLAGACFTAPFASNFLLGEDTNSTFTCDDYSEDGDYGFLIHLICNPGLQDNMQSLAFGEDGTAFSISFAQWGTDSNAVGVWNRGGQNVYPADMRIWGGTDFENQTGLAAMKLTSADEGSVYIASLAAPGTTDPLASEIRVDFKNVADASNCAASPSADNCYSQQIQILTPDEAVTDAPPAGFNLYIYGDDKDSPNFMAIEGKYRYSAAQAAAAWSGEDITALQDIRTIYFQVVQTGDEVFGKFEFKDESDQRLSFSVGSVDIFELLADGVCQDLSDGETEELNDTCDTITDFSIYDSLWRGEANVDSVTTSPVDVDFTGAPTQEGIVFAE